MNQRCGIRWATALLCLGCALPATAQDASWADAMRKVHARFKGTPGTFAQFGDSISVSMAFWAPLRGEPKSMPEDMADAHKRVQAYMKPECWTKWRGPAYGSNGGMTIRWAHENIDKWLKAHNPEVAVIMFGTNDLGGLQLAEYEEKTAQVVDRCLANGTIVILTTLPPRSGFVDKSKQFADAVRKIAKARQTPLIDYHAEILKRRPDDWDGTLPKFKDVPGSEYETSTLIARDGVHPSNPRAHQDYSRESLSKNGYALRNYLTLPAYADVIREVLQTKKDAAAPPAFPFDLAGARRYQADYAKQAGLPVEFENAPGMKLVLVPPGTFDMGSPESEPGRNGGGYIESPRHKVTLTRPLYLGKHEVTVGQFKKFVEATKYVTDGEKTGGGNAHDEKAVWKHRPGTNWLKPGYAGPYQLHQDHPVVHVSHTDALAFCRWLNAQPRGAAAPAGAYDLPTEAQWEWACRSGSAARFWWGDGEDETGKVANVGDRSLKRVHPDWPRTIMPMDDGYPFVAPVGNYRPNGFGLCDMLGNVWEFCSTKYGPYPSEHVTDPTDGDPKRGFAVRGGGWSNVAGDARCGTRNADPPHFCHSNLGFRVALILRAEAGDKSGRLPEKSPLLDRALPALLLAAQTTGDPPPKKAGPGALQPGETFVQDLLVTQKTKFMVQGLPLATHMQYRVVSRFTVDKPDDDGTFTVRQKIEEAKLVQADQLTQGLVAGPIAKLPGTTFTLKVSAAREVTKIDGVGEQAAAGPVLGGQGVQMASLLDRDGWKEMAQAALFKPAGNFIPGVRWSRSMTHNWGALGNWVGYMHYANAGRQQRLDKFAYAMQLGYVPAKPGKTPLPFQINKAAFVPQEAIGMIYYDRYIDRTVAAEERFRLRGALILDVLGQKAQVDLEEEQTFLMKINR